MRFLTPFFWKCKKYDQSLALGQSAGIMKDVVYKVKFVATKKPEAAATLRAEVSAYLVSISLLLGLYQVYVFTHSTSVNIIIQYETDCWLGLRKLNAVAEQKARQRFESLITTLATLRLQNASITSNVALVREQVEKGTLVVREEIERSSTNTSTAIKELYTGSTAAVTEIMGKVGQISILTIMS